MIVGKFLLACAGVLRVASATCSEPADPANFTVALVRAPPPNWPMPILNYDYSGLKFNVSACVDFGIELIYQAKAQGSDLITFPELWFPGFPKGLDYPEFNFTRNHLSDYIDNAIVVGDEQWKRIADAARRTSMYVNINFAERDGDFVYMAQSLISPSGDTLEHRRKLRPSGSERDLFSDGTTDGLKVVGTPYGRMGMLECGEHYYPSMTFNTHVQNEHIHLGPFPYLADNGDDKSLFWENEWINTGALSAYAFLGGTHVFTAAVGVSVVIDPLGYRVAHIGATADFDEFPMLYYSLNTTGFNTSQTYDSDSQTSWGTLSQMVDSFPGYVPKVEGSLVPQRNHSIAVLKAGQAAAQSE